LLPPKRVEKKMPMNERIPPSGSGVVGTWVVSILTIDGVILIGTDTGDTGVSFFTGTGLTIVTRSAT
jgi:hypothetical protein